jgi:hypothetical protein
MQPMTTALPDVRIARLHPDRIALYEAIHDGMTAEHAAATRARFARIDIFRLDDLLVMITEPAREPAGPPDAREQQMVRDWHARLAECFAEPWRTAPPIFCLALAGSVPGLRPGPSASRP